MFALIWRWIKIVLEAFGGVLSAMSGSASIILALVGLKYQGTPQIWLIVGAFVALWIVVLNSARNNYRLIERLSPKFKTSCDNLAGCVVPNDDNSGTYFRMIVESGNSGQLEKCLGHLTKIEKNNLVVFDHERRSLPFAPSQMEDSLAKTIHPGVPYHLDVLAVDAANRVWIAGKGHGVEPKGKDGKYIFAETGDYILTVSVCGQNAQTEKSKLKFFWTGDRNTASIAKA